MELLQKWSRVCYQPSVGLLLIRVVTGLIFISHGWMKYNNEGMIMGFMQSIGLPGFMAYAITTVELAGGVMLILGVLTRVAGVALAIAMLVAIVKVTYPHGGFDGSQLESLLLATSLGLAFIGAGKYRLTHLFEHDQQ